MLHLKLDRILAIIHLFVILRLFDSEDAFLRIWLLRVDGEDHIVGNQGFFRLLAGLIEDTKIIPDLPEFVLQSRRLSNVLK